MKQINTSLEKFLKDCNLWNGYRQFKLVQSWPDVVGASLSEVTRAENLQNGVLKVAVKDSVWSYHLSMMKPQLIDKLNQSAGSRMVKDISFRIDDQQ